MNRRALAGRTWLCSIVLILAAGCLADEGQATHVADSIDALSREVRDAGDSIAVANAIRRADVPSCLYLFTALAAMDAVSERVSGRQMVGLVGEAIEQAEQTCPTAVARIALTSLLRAPIAARFATPSRWVALSMLIDNHEAALSSIAFAPENPAVLVRRSDLLMALRRDAEARATLERLLEQEEDATGRVQAAHLAVVAGDSAAALALCDGRSDTALQRVCIAALAAASRYQEAARAISALPTHLRGEASQYAVAAVANDMALATNSAAPPELLVAVVEKRARSLPDHGVALLSRAVALASDDADILSALAEAHERSGNIAGAIAAWDRAAKHALGAERPILVPIRLLAESGRREAAMHRAHMLARAARSSELADQFRLAAFAYKYAGSAANAVGLARAAVSARPGEGRLHFELATRLEEAGLVGEAVAVLVSLWACGSRGRAWHRHEVGARLGQLVEAQELRRQLKRLSCQVVAPSELAPLLEPNKGVEH